MGKCVNENLLLVSCFDGRSSVNQLSYILSDLFGPVNKK